MPPRARRAPVWSNGELLYLIAVCGEEAVQSQLRSSRRNFDTFGQISRAMIERGHDRDAMQCRIKVKELRSAYRKAREANSRSGAPPKTCRFYKELDAILGGDPTTVPSTTVDTGERGEEGEEDEEGVEENRSEGAVAGGDTPDSLGVCSQELFSSQEEGSQSQRPVRAGREREEQVHDATLRSPPSFLSPAERLQRLRKRPRRTKEDMLQEVMKQSLKENEKAREWRESESRLRQENAAQQQQSMQLQHESTKELISILARQADSIQALVAMQAEQYRTRPPLQPVSQNTCAPMSPPAHFTQHPGSYRPHQMPPTPVASPDSPGNYDPYPLHSTPIPNYRHSEVQHSLHSTPDRKPEY
ncbi:uncharacterized protein RBU57_000878 [Macrochelys suwanniensis]